MKDFNFAPSRLCGKHETEPHYLKFFRKNYGFYCFLLVDLKNKLLLSINRAVT